MAISLNDLTILREKIAKDRKKLEEQEHALRVLEDMLGSEAPNTKHHVQGSLAISPVDTHEVRTSAKPTLPTKVAEIIQHFSGQEFTVPDIEALLRRHGYEIEGKTPRARIAMVMSSLEKKGTVIRTSRPAGGKPHTFILKERNEPTALASTG